MFHIAKKTSAGAKSGVKNLVVEAKISVVSAYDPSPSTYSILYRHTINVSEVATSLAISEEYFSR